MRCPSCGTQNEPNSRFCGGCGARLSAGESRLAPTQKITTGANEVQPRAQQVTPAPLPVSTPAPVIPATPLPGAADPRVGPAPMSLAGAPMPGAPMPEPSSGPVTIQQRPGGPRGQRSSGPQSAATSPLATPPGAYGAVVPSLETTLGAEPPRIPNSGRGVPVAGAPVGAPPRPARTSGPAGAAHPRRSWGLIVGVLVLDLGLAAAGAWMLSEGLSASDAPTPPPPAQSEPPPAAPGGATRTGEADAPRADAIATGEPATASAPAAATAASGDRAANSPAPTPAAEPPAAEPPPAAPDRKKKPAKRPPARGGGAGAPNRNPIDPYGEPDPLPPEQPPPPPRSSRSARPPPPPPPPEPS